MSNKTQSDAARQSERESRIISVVGCGMAFAGIALVFWLRNLGWSPEATLYVPLLAGAPVFAGLLYWVWRRNNNGAANGARRH
jgi:hypothetical protein